MPTITHTDYLLQKAAAAVNLNIVPGVWVRLLNNSTSTNYFSTAVTDAQGAFTHSAVPGDYSLFYGNAATVPGTPTLVNAHYSVPVTAGDDAALGSATVLSSSPYAPFLPGASSIPTPAGVTTGKVWDYGGAAFNIAAYGGGESVADNSVAINAAIAAAGAINGARVVAAPQTTGVLPIQNSIIVASDVEFDTVGCQIKWTGAINGIMLQGPVVFAPLVRVRLNAVDLDCNNVSGVTALYVNSWCYSTLQCIARNGAGAATVAFRIEASTGNTVSFPAPMFQNTANNLFDFETISFPIAEALSGYQIGATVYGVVTLNTFTRSRQFQITVFGHRNIQNCDTNTWIAPYTQLTANNAIGWIFNDSATPAADVDAKLACLINPAVDLAPLTLTGCNAFKFNWSAGNQIFGLNTNPTAAAWPGGPTVRINDVYGHSYHIIDSAGLPTIFTVKDYTINMLGQSQLQRSRQSVAFAATLAVDASLGELVTVTGTVNAACTISAPTNPLQGQELTYLFTKDNTGTGYVFTWNAAFKGNPQLGTDNNTIQAISWWYDGTNWQQMSPGLTDQVGSTWLPGKVTINGFVYSLTNRFLGQGNMQWDTLGAAGTHAWTNNNLGTTLATLGSTGILSTKNKIYPAQDTGAIQTVSAIYAGTGVPNNANGANGDFYFRGDTPGTAGQRLYIRSAGAWVATAL